MSELLSLSHQWFVHQRTLRMLELYLTSQLAPPGGYRLALSAPFRKSL